MQLPRLFILLLLFAIPLAGQTTSEQNAEEEEETEETQETSDEEDLRAFWQLALPDGHFMVSLDSIASISRSSYVLNGGLIVTEVTIDTTGNALCRIYQITPTAEQGGSSAAQRLTERARNLTDRIDQITGSEIANMVQKSYPTTTHAKTIEYRIQELTTLDSLYQSLNQAWSEGRGRRFTVPK